MATASTKTLNLCSSEYADIDTHKVAGPLILVVGEVSHWKKTGRNLTTNPTMIFAEFNEITSVMLDTLQPDIILSPLLCAAFDCLDLAQVLHSISFRGRYRVVTPTLPEPDIIVAEIKFLCPTLDFSFIFTGDQFLRPVN